MNQLLLAEELFDAVEKLDGAGRGAVMSFISQFRKSQKSAGHSLERVKKASPDVWSARVTEALRAILFRDEGAWYLLHVGEHDPAYHWAERRKISRNSITGVVTLIEVLKATVQAVEKPPGKAAQGPRFLDKHKDSYLLSLGVPEDWLPTLREVETDDQLVELASKLPQELADRLLELAVGTLVVPPTPLKNDAEISTRSDLRQRFYVVDNEDELRRALEEPHERWLVFLHPSQRFLVEAAMKGPIKVSGGAGTGKTVVAMHRARFLAKKGKSVLLTTFTRTMVRELERSLTLFCTADEREHIRVQTLSSEVMAAASKVAPGLNAASDAQVRDAMGRAAAGQKTFSTDFLLAEWEAVVARHNAFSLPLYLRARRVGRGRALSREERAQIWGLFEAMLVDLRGKQVAPWDILCQMATEAVTTGKAARTHDAVLVDEVQDLTPSQLLFVKSLCKDPSLLMLVGDAGQRIYRGGFALSSLGIDVRGRSFVLRVNYRTTRQIRVAADRVLGDAIDDLDGGQESRKGVRNLLNGAEPMLTSYASAAEERKAAVALVAGWLKAGKPPASIALFASTNEAVKALQKALEKAKVAVALLENDALSSDGVRLGTMHRAKGLEFRSVLVAGCSQNELSKLGSRDVDADRVDVATADELRRNLLYVAMTRARDELVVSWSGAPALCLGTLLGKKA